MQSLIRSSHNHLKFINKPWSRSVAVSSTGVSKAKSWQKIPGPPTIPMYLYHFLQKAMPKANRDYDVMLQLNKQYGPIVRVNGIFGSPVSIFLFDTEATAQILRSENIMPNRCSFQSIDYFRRKYYNSENDPNKPVGLITDQGEVWKKFRLAVNPVLMQPKTVKLYSNVFNEVAEDMINRMRSIRNDKNTLDGNFMEEMNKWALESISVVALGCRLNCLDPNLPDDSSVKGIIEVVHQVFKVIHELDLQSNLWRYITTPQFRRAMKIYERQAVLGKYFSDNVIKDIRAGRKNSGSERAVIEKLLEIDPYFAEIIVNDMLFGGVDTTANTIAFALYLLAKNQDKQNKLREEVMSGSEKRPYVKACIKESMRVMPVIHVNLRTTTRDYNIMGYRIPKDMNMIFGHHVMTSSDENYPRPKEYIPERWITDKSDPLYYGNAHPFAFNPFGFGTRSCLGRRFAELEMEIMLSKVIKNFHVEWFGPPLKVRPTTINYAEPPYNFVFKDLK